MQQFTVVGGVMGCHIIVWYTRTGGCHCSLYGEQNDYRRACVVSQLLCVPCAPHLGDFLFGLLQFVRLVGPQQLGLGFSLLLQRVLSLLPSLPRPHTLVKTTLTKHNVRLGEDSNTTPDLSEDRNKGETSLKHQA